MPVWGPAPRAKFKRVKFLFVCFSDPPLSEQDIPNGLWICHTCKMTDQGSATQETRPDAAMAESSQISKIKKMRNRSNSRKNSANSAGGAEKGTIVDERVEKELEDLSSLSPLDQLIRAARILNPRQFELPREINSHFPFPGTEKQDSGQKNGNGKRGPRGRKVYELDGYGLVPLPAKTCHTCGKSCRRAPLIACDYCDLFFHQDCLDPPLTALPTSMWMCPNHVEQFIVSTYQLMALDSILIIIFSRIGSWSTRSRPRKE